MEVVISMEKNLKDKSSDKKSAKYKLRCTAGMPHLVP